jgi:hypothetical protein
MDYCGDCLLSDVCADDYPGVGNGPPCASRPVESAPSASTIIARDAIALLREVFYARLPLGTRVDDAICEVDTSIYDRVHSFLAAQQAPVA